MATIIAAIAENFAIGKDNDLLWSLPHDMAFFKSTTRGHSVIMGRKNYESIPVMYRPLPNRQNIIITRNKDYSAPGCLVVTSLSEALKIQSQGIAFIIGGGEIYRLALEQQVVETMYITHVHASFEAEAYFPKFDENQWEKEIISDYSIDQNHAYSFTIVKYYRKTAQ